MNKRVFVIGAGGMVGATVAHAIAMQEILHDIVLIDVAQDLVRGQAADINHAAAFTNGVRVRVGDYADIEEDDIIIVTCGVSTKPGQTRLDLLATNSRIIEDVVRKVMARDRQVTIVMVSNPVDVLTHMALRVSGLPKSKVFGSGTALDTARLRVTLANALQVSQREVQAFVLGEHGDSSFPALWSATVGGVPLTSFPGFDPSLTKTIGSDIRQAAYQIVRAKKSTYHGIGSTVAAIVEALTKDTASVFPVCSLAEGEYGLHDVVVGLPSLVSRHGVKILEDYPLNKDELTQLHTSAAVVKAAMANPAC